jgi:hypothetical protein
LTQAVDLAPTLAEALGVGWPAGHGQSLWPLARGEVEQVRPYAGSGLQVGDGIEWRLQTPHWAYLLPIQPHPADPSRTAQLYVKPDDRWEINNVLHHHQEWAERLEQTLRAFVAAVGREPFQPPALPQREDAEGARPPEEGS